MTNECPMTHASPGESESAGKPDALQTLARVLPPSCALSRSVWSASGLPALSLTNKPCDPVERRSSRLKPGLRTSSLVIGIWSFIGHWSLVIGHLSAAPVFHLPTANHALFERG